MNLLRYTGTELNQSMNSDTLYLTISLQFFLQNWHTLVMLVCVYVLRTQLQMQH